MREQPGLSLRDMNGVDRSESLAQNIYLVKQLDWCSPIFSQALLDFRGLLGHMHMQWNSASLRVFCNPAEILDWNCAKAMRSNANPHQVCQALSLHPIGQRLGILDEVIPSGCDEPRLAGISRFFESGSAVGGPQQGKTDSDIACGLDNQFRQ